MVRPLPVALAAMIGLTVACTAGGAGTARQHGLDVHRLALLGCRLSRPRYMANGAARQAYDAERAMAEMPELAEDRDPARRAGHLPFRLRPLRLGGHPRTAPGSRRRIGDFLEAQGFYVAHRSFSNYMSTGPSLASTFQWTI